MSGNFSLQYIGKRPSECSWKFGFDVLVPGKIK